MAAAEDEWRRHLGGRLELTIVSREGSDDLEPARCCDGAGSHNMLARPVQLQLERQRPSMSSGIGEAGESRQLGARAFEPEAKPSAFLEIALHGVVHGMAAIHAALHGQGIATADSRPVSTLA